MAYKLFFSFLILYFLLLLTHPSFSASFSTPVLSSSTSRTTQTFFNSGAPNSSTSTTNPNHLSFLIFHTLNSTQCSRLCFLISKTHNLPLNFSLLLLTFSYFTLNLHSFVFKCYSFTSKLSLKVLKRNLLRYFIKHFQEQN